MELLLEPVREWGRLGGEGGREVGTLSDSRVRFHEDSWSPLVGRRGAGIELLKGCDDLCSMEDAGTSADEPSDA
jgi:hypothetical protein